MTGDVAFYVGLARQAADVADLEVEALFGGFASEPFTDDSRDYVFVTRRPGGNQWV
jgi:hypothetical protein